MPPVDFTATRRESDLIQRIAARAALELGVDKLSTAMDLTVAKNDVPLDLEKLQAFSAFDFAHDVCGIARHLDRTTGKLDGEFLPRCAVAEAVR